MLVILIGVLHGCSPSTLALLAGGTFFAKMDLRCRNSRFGIAFIAEHARYRHKERYGNLPPVSAQLCQRDYGRLRNAR